MPRRRTKTTCRRGHPLTGANVYTRPNNATECWVCKLSARWAYWSVRDSAYEPGPGARAKIAELRAEGLWGSPHGADAVNVEAIV